MALYAITYVYVDDVETVTQAKPEHRAYLRGLHDAGQLAASGPFTTPGPNSALLIFVADSIEQASALSDDDPIVAKGLVAERHIQEWNVVIGEVGR